MTLNRTRDIHKRCDTAATRDLKVVSVWQPADAFWLTTVPTKHVPSVFVWIRRDHARSTGEYEPRRAAKAPAPSLVHSLPCLSVYLHWFLLRLFLAPADWSRGRRRTSIMLLLVVVGEGEEWGSDCKYGGLAAIAGETRSRSFNTHYFYSGEGSRGRNKIHK